jgi:two-component system sensor histidine kinase DegS
MKKRQGLAFPDSADLSGVFHRPARVRPLFDADYRRALGEYLAHRDEDHLGVASELGFLALRRGMSIGDLVRLHEDARTVLVAPGEAGSEVTQQRRAASEFLQDALSPFEAALRRLPAAQARVGDLELALARRGQELAELVPRQLEVEAALRCSKARTLKLCQQVRLLKTEILTHPDKLVQVHEAERKRVSRELHDDIGQLLVALSVRLEAVKKDAALGEALQRQVEAAQDLVAQTMESTHRICRNLRADALVRLGLRGAVADYVRTFAERAGIRGFMQDTADLSGLGVEQEVVLYRIAQESITNVVKHAHATRLEVRFLRLPRDICMEVADNGQAFNVEATLVEKGGLRLGLLGMRERVQLMRGDFTVESVIGRGTTVRVRLPLAARPVDPSVVRSPSLLASAHRPLFSRILFHEKNNYTSC